MVLPGLDRGAVAESGVPTLAVVENLDIVHDREPGTGPGGEHLVVVHLVLQRGKETFRNRIVPAHPSPAYRGTNLDLLAIFLKFARGVLTSFDALLSVKQQSACG